MNIKNANYFPIYVVSIFKEPILSFLTAQKKKILLIASLAFESLAACYYSFFKTHKVDPPDDWKKNIERLDGVELKNAKVVFLGECHIEPSHSAIHAQIINAYANDNDIILFEGLDNKVELLEDEQDYKKVIQFYGIKKKVRIQGWDDRKAFDQQTELIKQRHLKLREYIQSINNIGSYVKFELELFELDNKFIQLNQFLSTKPQEELDKIENDSGYQQLVSEVKTFCQPLNTLNQQIDDSTKQRNQSLIQKVNSLIQNIQIQNKKSRIFVIAGSAHFLHTRTNYNILNFFHPENCSLAIYKQKTPFTFNQVLNYHAKVSKLLTP